MSRLTDSIDELEETLDKANAFIEEQAHQLNQLSEEMVQATDDLADCNIQFEQFIKYANSVSPGIYTAFTASQVLEGTTP